MRAQAKGREGGVSHPPPLSTRPPLLHSHVSEEWLEVQGCFHSFRETRDDIISYVVRGADRARGPLARLCPAFPHPPRPPPQITPRQCVVSAKYIQEVVSKVTGAYNELREQQEIENKSLRQSRRRVASFKKNQAKEREVLLEMPPFRIGWARAPHHLCQAPAVHLLAAALTPTFTFNPNSRPQRHRRG